MQKLKAYSKLFLFVGVSVLALPIVLGLADKISGGAVTNILGKVTGGISGALGLAKTAAPEETGIVTIESLRG